MFKTPTEIASALGQRIRTRRLGFDWTQMDAAKRAGVSYATWRRIEADGKASIEDLVKAAVALRCERELEMLFPPVAAASMDQLLAQQSQAGPAMVRRRASGSSKRKSS